MPAVEAQKSTEVRIDGRFYDISGFNKHPGGSIIKFYAGHGDATEAFGQMHLRSTRAAKMLKALPNRPAPETPNTPEEKRYAKMSADFAKLRKQLEDEGWYDPSPAHMVYRVAELIVMHMVGVYCILNAGMPVLGLLVLGIAQGRCGWLMHEAGHFSMTGNCWVDHRLQELFFGLGCGMSAAWWRIQHNKHHATPQKLHHDPDLDTLPLVAFNKIIALAGKNSVVTKVMVPLQAYLFPVLTCSLVTWQWQFFLHPRHMMRRKIYLEVFWAWVVRWAAIVALSSAAGATFGQAAAAYLFYDFIGGGYIFTNFALSHTHLDVVAKDSDVHWLEYASTHTINITPHFFTNWWMSYLNYQIEHHLFPAMPQFRFVKLAPRVRALFERNGIKYDVRDYFSAMGDTFQNLHTVGKAV